MIGEFIDRDGRVRPVASLIAFAEFIQAGAIDAATLVRLSGSDVYAKAATLDAYRALAGMRAPPAPATMLAVSKGDSETEVTVEPDTPPLFDRSEFDGLRTRLGALRKALIATLLFAALPIGLNLWNFSLLSRLRALARHYGIGNIPSHLIPDFQSVESLAWLATAGVILTFIAFAVGLYQARRLAEELHLTGFHWSFRWTIAASIIPFLNLYRPWVGLGEIDRALSNAARLRRFGDSWNTGFSWVALATALTVVVCSVASQAIGQQFERVVFSPERWFNAMALALQLQVWSVLTQVALAAVLACVLWRFARAGATLIGVAMRRSV